MRTNYKAAICGAHSQGKTTLVNALKMQSVLTSTNHFSFRTNLTRDSIKEIVQLNQILMIVVNVEKEEILQWIN